MNTILKNNLSKVEKLQPKDVFKYFAEISSIPRGSGNTDQIAEYLINFAINNNLKYDKDSFNNVIITKESKSNTKHDITFQAHIDMVCVKSDDCSKDLAKEGIDLIIEGDYLKADKTSLGADDGIGVAIILAVLANGKDYGRNIIGVFTSDEEKGMVGAKHLEISNINSKFFINLDSESYGEIVLGCSSGFHLMLNKKYSFKKIEEESYSFDIELSGGLGGHSAIEITKNRLNANIMLARVLYELSKEVQIRLVKIEGGTFDNIIPNKCSATIVVSANDKDKIISILTKYNKVLKQEYENSDSDILMSYKTSDIVKNHIAISFDDTINVLKMLYIVPNGLMDIMPDFPDVAETSMNLGKIVLSEEKCSISYMVRSAVGTKCIYVSNKIIEIAKLFGFDVISSNSYPEWKYKKQSYLRDKVQELSFSINKDKLIPKVTHGGLECGIILNNVENIDAISIGPTIDNPHSINEKLTISTVSKIYNVILKLIIEL